MPQPPEKLLCCPFCGANASLSPLDEGPPTLVECCNEKCRVLAYVYADTEAEAIAHWNTRAPNFLEARADALGKLVAEMAAKLEYLARVGLFTPSQKTRALLAKAKTILTA